MKRPFLIFFVLFAVGCFPAVAFAAFGDTTTWIGSLVGGDGGPQKEAQFDQPQDWVRDGDTWYLVDSSNHVIRKIDGAGTVSRVAGTGALGDQDGAASSAQFNQPSAITRDSNGDLYIADTGNHKIKKISGGTVSTIVNSGLSSPRGLRLHGDTLYISDTGNHAVKSVAKTGGSVRTIASSGLNTPTKLEPSSDGSVLYVADTGNYRIVTVTVSNGSVALLAGSGSNTYKEGTGSGASFTVIGGLKLDGATLYVVDGDGFFDQLSRVNTATGQVTLIRDDPQMITINTARGIDLYQNDYYILNGGSSQIYRIPFSDTGSGEWVAGAGRFGNKNGSGTNAWVGRPWDLVISRDRTTMYLSENNKLRQIDRATATISSLAGSDIDHYVEGTGATARFSNTMGIALNSTGDTLYVVDRNNHRIRKVDLATQTTSLVTGAGLTNFGITGTNGYQEGSRCETEQIGVAGCAYFQRPTGLAITSDDRYLYVADTGNNRIRRVQISNGDTTLVAGSGSAGFTNGVGSAASFNDPFGIALDASEQSLFVADRDNHAIRKIRLSTGEVTTVAGTGNAGFRDAVGTGAYFSVPQFVEYDPAGFLYVSEVGGQRIRVIQLSNSLVSTVSGDGTAGFVDGSQTTTRWNSPTGMALDATDDRLYVADGSNDLLRRVDVSGEIVLPDDPPTVTRLSHTTFEKAGKTTDTKMIEVNGTGFRHPVAAKFGPFSVETFLGSSTSMAVRMPFGLMPPGTYDVMVINPDTQFDVLESAFHITDGGKLPESHYTVDSTIPTGVEPASFSWMAYDARLRGEFFVATGNFEGDQGEEIVTGTGVGFGPHVRTFTPAGKVLRSFFAYDARLRSGIRLAVGDVEGDGRREIVTVAGPSGRPHVQIFNAEGRRLTPGFFALDGVFTGGAFIAVGDVNGDQKDEIVVSAGKGGSPLVTIHKKDGTKIASFLAYDAGFRGGVRVAVADVDGNGVDEILTVPDTGTTHVRQFRLEGSSVKLTHPGFFAFSSTFKNGASIAGADIDGDGNKEIVVGIGNGSAPHVRIFGHTGKQEDDFYAYAPTFLGGVNVAGGNVNGKGVDEIVVIPRSAGGPNVRVISRE
jgi:sugar lactone lactonase YvrE